METKVLNYHIIIEPDKRTGTNEKCYSAFCPTLGISDSGDTIDEAITNLTKAIKVWVKSLTKDGEPVPVDHLEKTIITTTSIKAPLNIRLAI